MTKSAELQVKLAEVLHAMIPEEGIDRYAIYGELYHDEGDLFAPILCEAMSRARDTGDLQACPNNGPHRHVMLQFWDAFIDRGMDGLLDYERSALLWPVKQHLAKIFLSWTQDPTGEARQAHQDMPVSIASILANVPGHKTIRPQHVETVAALLARELADPRSPEIETLSDDRSSALDGQKLDVRFHGWTPVLYGRVAPSDRWPTPVELPEAPPPARHYVLPTSGQLIMFSTSDTAEPLGGLLHEVTVRRGKLPSDFGADTGANQHVLNVFAATGMITLPMGDHFPAAYQEGEIIRGTTRLEDPDDGMEPLTPGSLDDPVFCDRADLIAFMIDYGGLADEAAADAWLAEALADRSIAQVEVPAGEIHLYAPDGWRADDFDEKFRAPGLRQIEGESTYFVISPTPLQLEAGMCTDVELPTRAVSLHEEVAIEP